VWYVTAEVTKRRTSPAPSPADQPLDREELARSIRALKAELDARPPATPEQEAEAQRWFREQSKKNRSKGKTLIWFR